MPSHSFWTEHVNVTRRYFLRRGSFGLAAYASLCQAVKGAESAETRDPQLQAAIDQLETWLTSQHQFRDVSRGQPLPHSLPEARRIEVGLTRETWKLEVISDPEHPARLRKPLLRSDNTALDFATLLQIAETHAVRFAKVMTCLNLGCPLGCGIWEGVPLRDILWRTQPIEDWRRVIYDGFHNDDPQQQFRSSLPVSRVLEDPYDLPPVILCYKLNGQWLTPERGGPVRMVVPEAYGFKSIKWLKTVMLSNLPHANDTYAEGNNDLDSPLKTFAATLYVPSLVKPGEPIAVTGYAQVGLAGLSKVQVWLHDDRSPLPEGDRYFASAPWKDAAVLPPPLRWGGEVPGERIPIKTIAFDDQGQPREWPLRYTKVHWAVLLPGLPAGEYTFRCRSIDQKGIAQPLPRPFQKSGHAAIEEVPLTVKR